MVCVVCAALLVTVHKKIYMDLHTSYQKCQAEREKALVMCYVFPDVCTCATNKSMKTFKCVHLLSFTYICTKCPSENATHMISHQEKRENAADHVMRMMMMSMQQPLPHFTTTTFATTTTTGVRPLTHPQQQPSLAPAQQAHDELDDDEEEDKEEMELLPDPCDLNSFRAHKRFVLQCIDLEQAITCPSCVLLKFTFDEDTRRWTTDARLAAVCANVCARVRQ